MCNEEGNIIKHGATQKLAEDEFLTFGLYPYIEFAIKKNVSPASSPTIALLSPGGGAGSGTGCWRKRIP